MQKCLCCGYWTIDDSDEIIADICDVCFWQYNEAGNTKPNVAVGPNSVSLEQARENFKSFRASEQRFISNVRPPFDDEIWIAGKQLSLYMVWRSTVSYVWSSFAKWAVLDAITSGFS